MEARVAAEVGYSTVPGQNIMQVDRSSVYTEMRNARVS